ncbi:MAG: CoB--CoM heterodisulfide reductase iron-sulfur subunit A family protein, partial [Thermoplasmata archaeon]|nr:CoB--CoM heterodisulfide reductase iron-sulfur subunit A family protein [Thermoplasmata archaeon]
MDAEKEPRVGVYICNCRKEISEHIDLDELAEFAKKRPNVVIVKQHDAICSAEGQEFLKAEINENEIDRIVVVACTPKIYEPIIRKAIEDTSLNKYLYEQANIREQCAWVHEDRAEATSKAKIILASSIARAINLETIEDLEVDITQAALVIGGG